jgi:hypothetical protein
VAGDVFNVLDVNDIQNEQIEELFRGQANSWRGEDGVASWYLRELFAHRSHAPLGTVGAWLRLGCWAVRFTGISKCGRARSSRTSAFAPASGRYNCISSG